MLQVNKTFSCAGDIVNAKVPAISRMVSFSLPHQVDQHKHNRAQFIYASEGAIQMQLGEREWYLPSTQALWIPPANIHSLIARKSVSYVSVFVDPSRLQDLPDVATLYQPNRLLHELIIASAQYQEDYRTGTAEYRLIEVLLDQLQTLKTGSWSLPMPKSRGLKKIIDDFLSNPVIDHSLANYSNCIGASLRTLQRQFRKETGYEFSIWRQNYLVQHAIGLMRQGHSVTRIALDFGYKNSASFSTMFKRTTGSSPKKYLAQNQ